MSLIITSHSNNIGTIVLNHPETRNSLSNLLLSELIGALESFEKRKARAVVIRSAAGVKVWSSGFDITELPVPGRDPLSYNDPLEQALRAIQLFPAPIIWRGRTPSAKNVNRSSKESSFVSTGRDLHRERLNMPLPVLFYTWLRSISSAGWGAR